MKRLKSHAKSSGIVKALAKKILQELSSYCKKIQVAGSIRRGEKNPVDIDIVLIPKDRHKIESFMAKKGKFLQGGEHKARWRINGVKVELYYTTQESWGATLLAYSSRLGSAIGLRMIAKRKGLKLNNYGLFKRTRKIAGKTEREIYQALDRPYKEPEDR